MLCSEITHLIIKIIKDNFDQEVDNLVDKQDSISFNRWYNWQTTGHIFRQVNCWIHWIVKSEKNWQERWNTRTQIWKSAIDNLYYSSHLIFMVSNISTINPFYTGKCYNNNHNVTCPWLINYRKSWVIRYTDLNLYPENHISSFTRYSETFCFIIVEAFLQDF